MRRGGSGSGVSGRGADLREDRGRPGRPARQDRGDPAGEPQVRDLCGALQPLRDPRRDPAARAGYLRGAYGYGNGDHDVYRAG